MFQDIVGSFHIASKDQKKVWDFIKTTNERPRSPPDWLEGSNKATLWANLLKVWDQMHIQLGERTRQRPKVSSPTYSRSASPGMRRSDPDVQPMSLPPEHETYMLKEAREYHRSHDEVPVFVINKKKAFTKSVIIPTGDLGVPDIPTRATLQERRWDSVYSYYTMDLNGIRLIVKSFAGGPKGGVRYLWWRGPSKGFDKKTIAFGDRQNGEVTPRLGTDHNETETERRVSQVTSVKSLHSGRRQHSATPTPLRDFDDDYRNISETPEPRPNEREALLNSFKLPRRSEPASSNSRSRHSSTFTNASQELSDSQRPSTSISSPHPRLDSETAEDPRPAKRAKTSHSSPTSSLPRAGARQSSQQSLTPKGDRASSRLQGASVVHSPTSGSKNDVVSLTPEIVASNPQAIASTPEITASNPQAIASTPGPNSMPLTKYKQDNTKLRIWMDDSDRFRSIRFRSCSTTSAFFDAVASAVTLPKDAIVDLTVVFEWKEENDKARKMAMCIDDLDCIEDLIEEVDNASVWGTGGTGRCIVGVLVQTRKA